MRGRPTVLYASLALAAAAAAQDATPDPAWDRIFTRESGWNGGDIGHAIDLADGRTLWLFGDSIVGPVRDGARIGAESTMVRGAIAWHETPADGRPPADVRFAIPEPGHDVPVASWIAPPPDLFPEGTWYWLMGDGVVVADAAGDRRLVLFASATGPAGNPDGMWNFRRVGGAIITIDNPADAPTDWRAVHRVNPLVTDTPRHGEPARRGENWGLAVVAWPRDAPVGARTLYVYAERSSTPRDHQLLVARCAEDDLDDPTAWTFFDGAAWSPDPAAAAPVADDVVTEFTIQHVAHDGRGELVLVQSEPMLGHHVQARTAAAPEGPWSRPTPLFEVAEPGEDRRLITYAAKGHAALSPPGVLLVTYVVNSTDFGQIFRDPTLYRPRFVRVALEALPTPP